MIVAAAFAVIPWGVTGGGYTDRGIEGGGGGAK